MSDYNKIWEIWTYERWNVQEYKIIQNNKNENG